MTLRVSGGCGPGACRRVETGVVQTVDGASRNARLSDDRTSRAVGYAAWYHARGVGDCDSSRAGAQSSTDARRASSACASDALLGPVRGGLSALGDAALDDLRPLLVVQRIIQREAARGECAVRLIRELRVHRRRLWRLDGRGLRPAGFGRSVGGELARVEAREPGDLASSAERSAPGMRWRRRAAGACWLGGGARFG